MRYSDNILIVDDVEDNIKVAMNILREDGYGFSFATSGDSALKLLRENSFDLVLLDIMMPGIDGFEVCLAMRSDERLREIPVIFLTAKTDVDSIARGFEVGGVDYILKPFHPEELLARVRTQLELYKSREVLKYNNLSLKTKMKQSIHRLQSELEESQKEIIYILTELMESVSDETGKHIKRVADYSMLLAYYHPSLTEEDVNTIYHASPMHDIGKITIPYEILHKSGKLTQEEFDIIKTHTTAAHSYLRSSKRKILQAADIIAHQHHENWDGSGYPQGLSAESIHIFGRIVALADVFDALTHDRVYKKAWSMDDAVEYIIQNRAKQFDPQLVEIFEAHLDEFIAISKL